MTRRHAGLPTPELVISADAAAQQHP